MAPVGGGAGRGHRSPQSPSCTCKVRLQNFCVVFSIPLCLVRINSWVFNQPKKLCTQFCLQSCTPKAAILYMHILEQILENFGETHFFLNDPAQDNHSASPNWLKQDLNCNFQLIYLVPSIGKNGTYHPASTVRASLSSVVTACRINSSLKQKCKERDNTEVKSHIQPNCRITMAEKRNC